MPDTSVGPTEATRPSIRAATALAEELLLWHGPSQATLEAVLERLALATAADRAWVVTVHQDDNGFIGDIPAEWATPGLPLIGADLGLAPGRAEDVGLTLWVDVLRSGTVIQERVANLPAGERVVWEQVGIAMLALVPLFVGDDWHGFIGLASGGDPGWTDEDIQALRSTGRVLATALEQERHRVASDAREARFRRLADNAADVIYRLELGADSHLSYVSPSVASVTGFTPADLYADAGLFVRQVHLDDQDELAARLSDPSIPGEPVPLRFTTKDGQAIWLELRSIPVHADGEVVAIEGIARDVTRQQEFSQALGERVKELSCLSQVRQLVQDLDDSAEICQRTADRLVAAMQWPDLAGARVQIDGGVHTVGPLEAATAFIVPVRVADTQRGEVLVGYTDPNLALLPEEQELVGVVAGILGDWLEASETVAALADSEARFRRLVDNARDIIYRYRVQPEPALEYVSPAITAITGYTPEEHIQAPFTSRFVHPDDVGTLERHLTSGGEESPFLIRFVAKDGALRWTEHRVTDVRDTAGTLVATEGIARDVTERVEAIAAVEQRVREQTAVARLGQAALAAGEDDLLSIACKLVAETLSIQLVAVSEVTPDGREILIRAGYGWRAGEIGHTRLPLTETSMSGRALHAKSPVTLQGLDDQAGAGSAFLDRYGVVAASTVVIGGRTAPFGTLDIGTTADRLFTTEELSFLQSVANILGEVIERDRADDELARREDEFRTIAEHAPDIIVRYDRDLRHLYVNETVTEKTGLPPEAFLGKTNREVGQPLELVELWERTGKQVLATGQRMSIEFAYPGPDGPLQFESHMIPELDAEGNVETVLVMARDLTERHLVEAQRREALTRIVQAQEAERARIAEDIHDDSIQVMAAAGMRLEALKHQLDDPAVLGTVERLEETVRRSIERLRSLMFELRPPELDREGLTSTLRQYLEATLHHGTPVWELTDELTRPLLPDLRTLLYRIVQESIANVRKHAGASIVQVTLDEVDADVRVRIRDDGSGFNVRTIAEEVGPHHFGLVSMRERAEGARGHLTIASMPGSGTTVTARVPFPAEQVSA